MRFKSIRKKNFAFLKEVLIATILLFIQIPDLLGQYPSLINYSTKQGLPSNEVYDIFQDSQGFIWFATDHGVAKFDGYQMKIFTVKDGLTDPVIFGFTEDEQRLIWLRTYSGKLSIYELGKITPYKWNNKLEELVQDNIIYGLQHSQGNILFGTDNYLAKVESNGTVLKEKNNDHELSIWITDDKKTTFGLKGVSNLVKKVKINNTYHSISLTDTTNHNKVICSLQDGDKTIFTINSNIFVYNGITVTKVFSGKGAIISLSKDREGYYWIGYANKGFDKAESKNFTITNQTEFLTNQSVTRVLHDHEGGIWFSTLESGVYYSPNLSTLKIDNINKIRCATFNSEYAVIADQQGYISSHSLETGQKVWSKNFGRAARSLYIDPRNQLWISTNHTALVDLETGNIKHTSLNVSHSDYTIGPDSTLWAVGGIRISQLTLNGGSKHKFSNSIHLKVLCDSLLYTAGRTGLDILDLNMNLINRPTALINSRITSIIPFDKDFIFIGTVGNGFHLLRKKNFQMISFNEGKKFIAYDIYDAKKKDSLIWISTEKGIIALKSKDLTLNIIEIHKTIFKELNFERANFINVASQAIWAVSDYSITIIPVSKNKDEISPEFYFEWINPPANDLKVKVVTNNNKPLQLRFGFISFKNQNIYYRYKISQSSDWIETTQRTIEFQSIEAGNYFLTLEYSTDKKNWLRGTSIPFLVLPPWWATWYFRFAVAIFIVAIAIALFKRRVARLKEKNKYLSMINDQQRKLLNAEIEATERERSRIAKDLHDSISIDLVSIKLITGRIAKKINAAEALEVETQVQKTVSEIRNIIHGLNPPGLKRFGLSATLVNYAAELRMKHSLSINYDFLGADIKNERLGTMIFRILQELTTNSIKHAKCKAIDLHINVFADGISIAYADNGRGFDPTQVTKGFGLSNIESRVTALGGQLHFESGEYGTSYAINLPLQPDLPHQ